MGSAKKRLGARVAKNTANLSTVVPHAFDDLRRTLTLARACEGVWWLLEGEHPERLTIIKSANRYLHFFTALRPAMYTAFITLVASLFDESAESISLKSIPEIATQPTLGDLWARGRRLYRYRSKSIAHRDIRNNEVDFAKATGFTYDQVRAILHEACALFEAHAQVKNLAPLPPSKFSAAEDLLKVLRELAT